MMGLKIISVHLYSIKEQSLSSLGRTITVKFSADGKVTKEMVLNDSVMNLPSDSCQLAGVPAKTFSMMDRTSTDEAFALLQLERMTDDEWKQLPLQCMTLYFISTAELSPTYLRA